MPDIGTLQTYRIPQGPGVRVDDGFEEGMDIPIYYDPMISKLITWDADRNLAIRKMIRAIDEYSITGVTTTLAFCRFVMGHGAFVSGNFDTHFVRDHFTPKELEISVKEEEEIAAYLAALVASGRVAPSPEKMNAGKAGSSWKRNRGGISD